MGTKRNQRFWILVLLTTSLLTLNRNCCGEGVNIGLLGFRVHGGIERHGPDLIDDWCKRTGNQVHYLDTPDSTTDRYTLYEQNWAARTPDVDIYMLDVTWQGAALPHAIDLTRYFSPAEINEHFSRIVANNTVNGHLVSMPFVTDVGILYYRTDLLQKYGFKSPPSTWKELTAMARTIQEGERASGNSNFFGYLWQGRKEGLVMNALEWISSCGGGSMIESDGAVSVNNSKSVEALNMGKSWLGTISPRGETTYSEEDCRQIFENGNAALMRNWPYVYLLANRAGCPVAGKFSVTLLPAGTEHGLHSGGFGGWNLMISKYSKHPEVAADLIRLMTSATAQKQAAIEFGTLPTRPALYVDKELINKVPLLERMLPSLENAVARPSTPLKDNYNQFSAEVAQNIEEFLEGEQSAETTVGKIEQIAKRLSQ
ncbi:MAG TPA: ABC transporter substrate-binding protein [Chthoniobacterales bacterium]|jgi:trehalose/maltose transport system substrate-binding protein|nr:ABC transporter substrate-binding protein [Chthoniobacterales bacterium]